MKIGVDIPSDRHGATVFLFLCMVALFFFLSGRNFEYIKASWVFLLCAGYVLYRSFVVSRRYTVDETGITAHYWGIYHLHRPWDYFGDVGVYEVHHEVYSLLVFIIFSKKKWAAQNKIKFSWRFCWFPFSAFYILYSPERFEEIKKYCPRITWYTDETPFRTYLLDSKKKRKGRRDKERAGD